MKIEVGDVVVFRTDLVIGELYGILTYIEQMDEDIKNSSLVVESEDYGFRIVEGGYWFTPEMVSEVIKPTKESQQTEFDIALLEGSLFWVEWLEASKSNALNEETTSAAIRDMYKKINEIIEHLKNR